MHCLFTRAASTLLTSSHTFHQDTAPHGPVLIPSLTHSHMHLMIARQHRATSVSLVQFPVKNKLSLPLLAAALNSLISSLRRYRRSGRSSLHSSCPGREITLGPWAQESHSHHFQVLPQLICQTALASSKRRGRGGELFLQDLRNCNMQIEFAVGR